MCSVPDEVELRDVGLTLEAAQRYPAGGVHDHVGLELHRGLHASSAVGHLEPDGLHPVQLHRLVAIAAEHVPALLRGDGGHIRPDQPAHPCHQHTHPIRTVSLLSRDGSTAWLGKEAISPVPRRGDRGFDQISPDHPLDIASTLAL